VRLTERIVDATARRPAGPLAWIAYGGALGAPKAHERVFGRLLARIGALDGERVVELGCGAGRLIELALDAGAAGVAAIDHSAEMLALSWDRNRRAGQAGRLELRQGDVAALPWPERAFTVALSANAFFFFADPSRVLAELHRVLAPGGRLAIATAPGPLPHGSLRNWWVWVWGSQMRVYTDEQLRSLLDGAGFAEVDVQSSRDGEPLQVAYGIRR
jgi:SAM-dependent methyltransferase